jgi:hypothetical protein
MRISPRFGTAFIIRNTLQRMTINDSAYLYGILRLLVVVEKMYFILAAQGCGQINT